MSRPTPHGRGHYRHFITIATRWADNDVYGHVNNTVYYHWFDTAVNQWLVAQGLLDIAHGDQIGLVVETGCSYFTPLSFPGDVDVGLAVQRLGISSVTYRLGIFAAGSSEPSAQGQFTHVYVDRENRRPAALPDAWRKLLETLT
ncbi:acyl-CoA thioesterase [Sphingomonas sp. G124]|uniref:Acyl-CoA thioesterase n=1 Tax=Sphingomonas cremea TaxID=2904799 RepID=A0A9X1QKD3_9SPHN|nr:thioesterase family protein [Sphingomonas cremea]MCF2514311.1 acyl-CoA thioesterase [Sphingomonas cremea]